ncbi:MAG TPA: ATP-binding protein [Thermodesulfobacteriota bacterium]|mgnify:CR=1 FL=1|nr:ATP-binding protein [Thermodesulfobacteriota bacterium]
MLIKRRLEKEMVKALERSPSVALTGPRQVGKTTLALNIAETEPSVYLDLENPLDLEKVRDIAVFHAANRDKLIILDEVQRLPEIFPRVRGIIDRERRKGRKTGQFLFLGSASLSLLQQSGESLAGRIAYLELFPVDVLELTDTETGGVNTLWLRGGFPESLLAASDHDSLAWRRDFIRTYLERDIPQLGPRIPAETLQRLWTMLAHNQGAPVNAAQLARSLGVSGTTIARYLDLMVDLLLVRRLQPWTFNEGKRLIRSPKVYVRDSGITHALLNITNYNDLLGHPVAGGSWEGFVLENILSVAFPGARSYYYRTPGGAEIDLVLEFGMRDRWAIEIKRSSVPSLSRGFHIGCEDVKASRRYVVYSGPDTFSMESGVIAVSLADLMREIAKQGK